MDAPALASADRRLTRFWAHAAAFGAVWGTLEITVGSFLHTLRLPFSGVLLAATGAALLVAERQVLPARGLTVATGLVAATCKLLSPGGAILGPMIGIAGEALVVEVALLVAPRSVAAAALAGFASVAWASSQKLWSQYVFYGGDILSLYLAALREMAAALHLDGGVGWRVLGVIAAIILVVGGGAGVFGWRVGRACRARLASAGTA